jgi:hypothetical protein
VVVQNSSDAEKLCESLWNRDLAACLNMIHTVRSLRLNGKIPERFQRAGVESRGPTRRRQRSVKNEKRRDLPKIL